MKNLILLLLLLPMFSIAQDKLIIQGTSPDFFLMHKTGVKENFYSIGRIYNISPKLIAPFNNLQMEKGLSIGQPVKIPLTENNFSQNGVINPDEVLIPLYYQVKPKESLFQVSNAHNHVLLSSLRKWNGLSGDALSNGRMLVVGYLKVKRDLSSLAGRAVKVEPFEGTVAAPVSVPAPAPVKSTEVTMTQKVVDVPVDKTVIKTQTPPVSAVVKKDNERSFGGGVFKSLFKSTDAKATGIAGVFKSTSGWDDGKYYCLHNTAQPGTIIKITNSANGKIIYAKVLDAIPDLHQNAGMIVRLSNAAADELGVTAATFDCVLNY